MTIDADNVRLLRGPYRQPGLRVGDRAICNFRDASVVVTSWTDALISWPGADRSWCPWAVLGSWLMMTWPERFGANRPPRFSIGGVRRRRR